MKETPKESSLIRLLRAGVLLGSLVAIPTIAVCWNLLPKPKYVPEPPKSVAVATKTEPTAPESTTPSPDPFDLNPDFSKNSSLPSPLPAPPLVSASEAPKKADLFSTITSEPSLRAEPAYRVEPDIGSGQENPARPEPSLVSSSEPRFHGGLSGVGMLPTAKPLSDASTNDRSPTPSLSNPFSVNSVELNPSTPGPFALNPSEANAIKAMNWNGDDATRTTPIPTELEQLQTEPSKLGQTLLQIEPLNSDALQTLPVAGTIPVPGESSQKSFPALEMELQSLGAKYYRLEKWGSRGELFRFSCYVTAAEPNSYQKYFQAVDPNEVRVMERVIAEIRTWRRK